MNKKKYSIRSVGCTSIISHLIDWIRIGSVLSIMSIMSLGLSVVCRADTYPRWIAIGNSITQHGPKADLKWEGLARGMAASDRSHDYVHLLESALKQKNPANATELKIVGRLGRLSAGTIEQVAAIATELVEWQADLVTVQLGENDPLKTLGVEGFEARYRAVINALLSGSKRPVIVCTGVWAPSNPPAGATTCRYPDGSDAAVKEGIIERIAKEKGLLFVSMAPYAQDGRNFGTGGSDGVRWHPNDAGMEAYAKAIYTALYSEPAPVSAPLEK